MWNILNRSYKVYGLYLAVICLALTGVRGLLGNDINILFTLLSGVFLFMYAFSAVLVSEQYEEKHQGYSILSALPVRNIDVIGAKYLLPVVSVIGLTGFTIALFSSFSTSPSDWVLVRSYFLFMAGASLLMVGVMYIGVFSIGYTKFLIVVISLTTALGFVPLLVLKNNRDQMETLIENLLSWMRNLNWIVIVPLIFLVYLCLMFLSIRVKTLREI